LFRTQTLKALSSQLILVNQTQVSHTLKNINIMSHHRSVTTSKSFDDKDCSTKIVMYTAQSEDDDVAQKFIDMLEEDITRIYRVYLKYPKFKSLEKMIFTESDEACFNAATESYICGGELSKEAELSKADELGKEDELGKDSVRDHCHLTGKFRGAAHKKCKLEYRIRKFFPVIFHNLSGYDSHLFIKKLKPLCDDKNEKISCIAKNEESYITFSKKVLADSFMKEVIE